jgi:hypothetical protein
LQDFPSRLLSFDNVLALPALSPEMLVPSPPRLPGAD